MWCACTGVGVVGHQHNFTIRRAKSARTERLPRQGHGFPTAPAGALGSWAGAPHRAPSRTPRRRRQRPRTSRIYVLPESPELSELPEPPASPELPSFPELPELADDPLSLEPPDLPEFPVLFELPVLPKFALRYHLPFCFTSSPDSVAGSHVPDLQALNFSVAVAESRAAARDGITDPVDCQILTGDLRQLASTFRLITRR